MCVPFLVVKRDEEPPLPIDYEGRTRFVPSEFFPNERHSHIVQALSFEENWYGLFVMEYTTNETVYSLLREQVSSALKGSALHRTVLKQAAQREQLERAHLRQEAQIAARIQTGVLPRGPQVEGLEISAHMTPVADVGGDYYDVIPSADGCWLGIGDVAGHGLLAGLIMLMMQGMVAAMVRKHPRSSPSELITVLNSSLYENIRHRLGRNDHATLMLLRYERSGKLTFAGAHEDPIVYRAKTRTCELLTSSGVWVGVLPDVRRRMADSTCSLEAGDMLVLYSDGVIEAMNTHREQFGLDRLCQLVQTHAERGVEALSRSIMQAAEQWQARQLDDLTVLVARHHAAAVRAANCQSCREGQAS
jgi:sigma-B regulation protein RsbU (phosphoserine phosphatase)